MKILNKLTIKNLKLNKKRTIVTIIGIILSTALICAVAGMFTSLQQTLINTAIANSGNSHITIKDVAQEDLKYFSSNRYVASMYIINNLGYANLEGSINSSKPYVYIVGYTEEAFSNTTIDLIDGRLPENSSEIVIPESIINNANVDIEIGDRITFDVGNRVCSDGSILNQYNPYTQDEEDDECNETLTYEKTLEYTVVGIMSRLDYSLEGYQAPGYTVITYADDSTVYSYDVSLLFKNPAYYKTYIELLESSDELSGYSYVLNTELLRWQGVGLSDDNLRMFYAIAGVVIAIIIFTSVFVIRNSFNISITEKTKQYGMLSSIGATSKQIKNNVLYEGFILGLIGIPIGILSGLLAVFILCNVVNLLLGEYISGSEFTFSVSWLAILLSILLSAITIYFSVIAAARRSSKISPIEAIRNNNEIKIDSKKMKTPKIINKLFGVGGDIAYKNLKRSRKKYRTTVISLVVSVSVFISLSAFINYGFELANKYYTDIAYNISVTLLESNTNTVTSVEEYKKVYDNILTFDSIESYSLQRSATMDIDARTYMTDDGFYNVFLETKDGYTGDTTIPIVLLSLGEEEYTRFAGNSASSSGAIIIDSGAYYDNENNYINFNTYDLDAGDTIKGTLTNDETYELNIIGRLDTMPMGLENSYYNGGYFIISDELMDELEYSYTTLYINSSDTESLEKEIVNYLNGTEFKYSVSNIDDEVGATRTMILLISIFLYGFIIVISLIGVTNIFNTVTTNMNLRSKEFAMLKSIGMTKKEFNRMVHLESIFYGTKSLIIGIPLGILGSYLIYKSFAVGTDFGYMFPVGATIIAIIVVLLLISIIMHFSIKKINKQNIIETIRNDNI